MNKSFPIFASLLTLPACGTVQGAASDVRAVGGTAVQMVRDIPDIPLPALPEIDPSPFTEATEEVRQYCSALDQRWEIGKDQVALGKQLIAEGQARLEKGQQFVRDGERRITTGELAVESARRDLGLRTGRIKPVASDYESIEDPDQIKSIRVKMQQGLKRMEYGGEQVSYGAQEIEIGQQRVAEGIARMQQGHALMAEDKGRCRDLAKRVVEVGEPVLGDESDTQP